VQSCSQIVTTNIPTPNFGQAGCPSCHPTNSLKAFKGDIITLHRHVHPKLTRSHPNLSLTTNNSGLRWVMAANRCLECCFKFKHQIYYYNCTRFNGHCSRTAWERPILCRVGRYTLLYHTIAWERPILCRVGC